MNQRFAYSTNEDNLIISLAKQNPDNLKHSFRLSAARINRSVGSISQRYYKHLQTREAIFSLEGQESDVLVNRKNTPRVTSVSTVSIEILSYLWNKLSEKEKLDFFKTVL